MTESLTEKLARLEREVHETILGLEPSAQTIESLGSRSFSALRESDLRTAYHAAQGAIELSRDYLEAAAMRYPDTFNGEKLDPMVRALAELTAAAPSITLSAYVSSHVLRELGRSYEDETLVENASAQIDELYAHDIEGVGDGIRARMDLLRFHSPGLFRYL